MLPIVSEKQIVSFVRNNASRTEWMRAIMPGSPIVAIGTRDVRDLTRGAAYTAINGREDGIFEDRPFVTVETDDGKIRSFHLSRFMPLPYNPEK